MKIFIAVLFTMVIVSSLFAQEPKSDAHPTPPSTTLLEPLSPEPLTLIPDAPTTVPKPRNPSTDSLPDSQSSMTEAKATLEKSKAAADADDLKERILFRQVKTKAERDVKVQEQWDTIHSARTTQEKNRALKKYYDLLYARMLKLEGSLKDRIEKTKQATLIRINKTSEIPLNPAIHGENW